MDHGKKRESKETRTGCCDSDTVHSFTLLEMTFSCLFWQKSKSTYLSWWHYGKVASTTGRQEGSRRISLRATTPRSDKRRQFATTTITIISLLRKSFYRWVSGTSSWTLTCLSWWLALLSWRGRERSNKRGGISEYCWLSLTRTNRLSGTVVVLRQTKQTTEYLRSLGILCRNGDALFLLR